MVIFIRSIELRRIDELREISEVEHRVVLTVFAKERNVLSEVHILQMVCDKAAVTALYALAECREPIGCFR
jgi:hypothetical protein